MAKVYETVDTTMYEVYAMDTDGIHRKARIETAGINIGENAIYVSEITPPLKEFQDSVLKSLGAGVTRALGIGYSTVIFTPESARNLFPRPETVETINGELIGKQLVEIFYDES